MSDVEMEVSNSENMRAYFLNKSIHLSVAFKRMLCAHTETPETVFVIYSSLFY